MAESNWDRVEEIMRRVNEEMDNDQDQNDDENFGTDSQILFFVLIILLSALYALLRMGWNKLMAYLGWDQAENEEHSD